MNKHIKELALYAIYSGLTPKEDYYYVVNRLLDLLNLNEFDDVEVEKIDTKNPLKYISPLLDFAVSQNLIEDTVTQRDAFEAKMMDIFVPRPSMVARMFHDLNESFPNHGTDYLYNLSLKSNYIKEARVSKNITWKSPSTYGDIDMTINVSKPEKTIAEIKAAQEMKSTYPKCPLCIENVGFRGNAVKPARNNLRAVPIVINEENFRLQFSPYVYYNEHCIVFKEEHEPMSINETTFKRLLDFVEQFPHYFLGSNADLPIVGGSILSHEHYQGGNYEFPLQRASSLWEMESEGVTLRRLHWPLTVVQVEGSKEDVLKMATKIMNTWKDYTDEDADIVAFTDARHNTVTPIARMKDDVFQIDLALRNNRTSEKYPDGIFHSHPIHHHIKRENLGLIEVMGLSVLPARLVSELADVKKYLQGEEVELGVHTDWAKTLNSTDDLEAYINNEVGKKFVSCLENAGVFKTNDEGQKQFERFIEEVLHG